MEVLFCRRCGRMLVEGEDYVRRLCTECKVLQSDRRDRWGPGK